VPESFAEKLRGHDAEVVRAGDNYEASMQAALLAASENGWVLLSDTSWAEYLETPRQLMEGYLVMAAEAVEQMQSPPTHILLQAGVGGLASAAAGYFRKIWGSAPQIIIVEPDAAPALYNSIKAGKSKITLGPVSTMGRLDCKEPSLIALQGLAEDADLFCLISDAEAEAVLPHLNALDLETTPSGAAGLAAMFQNIEGIGDESRVLCVLSEASDS
jgi:diaminopropionate ammonia-lyase